MRMTGKQLRRIIREAWGDHPGAQDGVIQSLSDGVQQLVDQGGSLFDLEYILSGPRFGFNVETVTSPLPMVLIDTRGKKYAVLNSKYAEKPDAVVGPYAIGKLE